MNKAGLISVMSFLDSDGLLPHPLGRKGQSTETRIQTLFYYYFFKARILVLSRGTILSKVGVYDFNYLLENTEGINSDYNFSSLSVKATTLKLPI